MLELLLEELEVVKLSMSEIDLYMQNAIMIDVSLCAIAEDLEYNGLTPSDLINQFHPLYGLSVFFDELSETYMLIDNNIINGVL